MIPSPRRQGWELPGAFLRLADQPLAGLRAGLKRRSGLTVTGAAKDTDRQTAFETLKGPLLPRSLGAEIWAVAAGLKPAGRAILQDPADAARMEDWVRTQELAVLTAEIPVRTSFMVVGEEQDHRGGTLMFYGGDPALLKELLRIDQEILAARTLAETLEPCALHGRLLGYPTCCVDTFVHGLGAGENRAVKDHWFEYTTGDGWWPLNVINPLGPSLVGFYPCSLKCRAALDYAQKVMALPEVAKVMGDPRFMRAMSGEHWYWLDRLQVWHPPDRPDLAMCAQVLAESGNALPYRDEVDYLFAACVAAPMRRAKEVRLEDGALEMELPDGLLRISHPELTCLWFGFSAPPA